MYSSKGTIVASLLALSGGVFLPALAYAAGGGGGSHGPDLAFLFAIINFVLFVIILIKLLRNPVKQMFEQRSEELRGLIEKIREEREALTERKKELEEAVAKFEAASDDRIKIARNAAQEEAGHILDECKRQAESLVEGAQARAEDILHSGQEEAIDKFVASLLKELEEKLAAQDATIVDNAFAERVQNAVSSDGGKA